MPESGIEVESDLPPYARVPRWLVAQRDLSDAAVRMFAHLTRYEGLPQGIIPSLATLADELGWSKPKVKRTLKELEDGKAVTVERRTSKSGAPTSNRYTLLYGSRNGQIGVGSDMNLGSDMNPGGVKYDPRTERELKSINNQGATEQIVTRLCDYVASHLDRTPRTPHDTWQNEAVNMISVDRIPLDRITAVIDWLETEDARFWRQYITNVRKLREKFDQLDAQRMAARKEVTSRGSGLGLDFG